MTCQAPLAADVSSPRDARVCMSRSAAAARRRTGTTVGLEAYSREAASVPPSTGMPGAAGNGAASTAISSIFVA